ncbi:MAG: hypothetical protein CSA74_11970 [Rhodobacterales bacterium]|nr:MAG: hypothetical protein CSA74_11970 [Rhodobacterales bacterium]
MPRLTAVAPILLALPLAACFDAEMTLNVTDENTAEATMVMIASEEVYQMAKSGDEPFCEDGVEEKRDDGTYSCTETFTGSIDEALASPDIGDGLSIERRDGGLMFVSIDLTELTQDMTPPEEEGGEEMLAMMAGAFAGHAITINIGGKKVEETNGTVSEDGKTATLNIPLDKLFTGNADLPKSFDVLVEPGK